jgi:hypothetical protein
LPFGRRYPEKRAQTRITAAQPGEARNLTARKGHPRGEDGSGMKADFVRPLYQGDGDWVSVYL